MEKLTDHLIGKHVLIRSNMSGVHVGVLLSVSGNAVRLKASRRLWEWKVASNAGISLSEVAIAGIDHAGSKVTAELPDAVILDVCEIIEAHGLCVATVYGADTYKP